MELRSCSHLHFIDAIRGGVVTKLLNVDTHGKPALVFKQIKDIYDCEDAKNHSLSVVNTTENDDNGLKVDRTCLPITKGGPIGSESETRGFGSHGHCDERNSDLDDDLSFSSMTLTQLKERCKKKKRKLSKFVDLTKEDVEIFSSGKQEYQDLLLEEDDFDLKEPLSSWKLRLTKNRKAKKRCFSERVSTSSQSPVSEAKSKLVLSDWGFQQSTRDLSTLIKVEVEVAEPDCSDSQGFDDCSVVCHEQVEVGGSDCSGSQNVICVADDSSAGCNEQDEVLASDYSDSQGDADNCTMSCNEQVEVHVPDYSATQNMVCIADGCSLDCSEQVGFCEVVVSEMPTNDNESVLGTRHSIVYAEEPRQCTVNKISHEYNQLNSLPNVGPTIAETLEVDDPEKADNRASHLSVSEFRNEGFIAYPPTQGIPPLTFSPTKEHNSTPASPVSEIKDEGHVMQLLTPDISPQSLSPTKEHNSAALLPGSEFKNEEYVHLLAQDIFPQTLSPIKEHGSDTCNSSQSYSFNSCNGVRTPDAAIDISLNSCNGVQVPDAAIDNSPNSCNGVQVPDAAIDNSLNSCNGVQVPDAAIHNCLYYVEPSNGGVALAFEDDHTGNLPSTLPDSVTILPDGKCSSSWNSSPCLSATGSLVPKGDDLPTTEVKQILMISSSDTARDCSYSHPCDTTFKELTSAVTENCEHSELQHGPEKLFSTRKAISPTSQEKLCRAMNSIGLSEDMEPYKCKIKLQFAKQIEGRTSVAGSDIEGDEVGIGPGEPERSSENEVTVIPKQSIRRRKNLKSSYPKGILKFPQLAHGLPHLSNTCTSTQSYSQSAIAFSQRQMHDIESLATKLTRELKSMKDIVEETMNSEVCLATSLRYSTDEVRTAVETANKVEETTKRWLSMMARDCNRFCKIMKLTENESVTPGNAIHKERKKITFADEVGGELCHVKLFHHDMASSLEPSGGEQELLAK